MTTRAIDPREPISASRISLFRARFISYGPTVFLSTRKFGAHENFSPSGCARFFIKIPLLFLPLTPLARFFSQPCFSVQEFFCGNYPSKYLWASTPRRYCVLCSKAIFPHLLIDQVIKRYFHKPFCNSDFFTDISIKRQ